MNHRRLNIAFVCWENMPGAETHIVIWIFHILFNNIPTVLGASFIIFILFSVLLLPSCSCSLVLSLFLFRNSFYFDLQVFFGCFTVWTRESVADCEVIVFLCYDTFGIHVFSGKFHFRLGFLFGFHRFSANEALFSRNHTHIQLLFSVYVHFLPQSLSHIQTHTSQQSLHVFWLTVFCTIISQFWCKAFHLMYAEFNT